LFSLDFFRKIKISLAKKKFTMSGKRMPRVRLWNFFDQFFCIKNGEKITKWIFAVAPDLVQKFFDINLSGRGRPIPARFSS